MPIELKKEKAGYVLNSLLVPLLNAAAGLVLQGIADPGDRRQTLAHRNGSTRRTVPDLRRRRAHDRVQHRIGEPEPGSQAWAAYLKTNYIDQGKLGVATGEGFYRY